MNVPNVGPRLRARNALAAVVLGLTPVATIAAGALEMERWVVAGGGDVYTSSANGTWTLSGTLGETGASGPQHGGEWTLTGGFWAASTVTGESDSIFRDGFETR